MKHCGVEATITLSLLFILQLSSGAPTSNTGTTDSSELLGNISLSLRVLEKIISESDYITFCKLGLEAAEITGESSGMDLPEVTIQTAAQNLKDICNWVSNRIMHTKQKISHNNYIKFFFMTSNQNNTKIKILCLLFTPVLHLHN